LWSIGSKFGWRGFAHAVRKYKNPQQLLPLLGKNCIGSGGLPKKGYR
jgi:hypothetical protein